MDRNEMPAPIGEYDPCPNLDSLKIIAWAGVAVTTGILVIWVLDALSLVVLP